MTVSDVRPFPPWWQDRYHRDDELDVPDLVDDPVRPWVDVDEPRIDTYWDELDER
jgi:hypothetical protein